MRRYKGGAGGGGEGGGMHARTFAMPSWDASEGVRGLADVTRVSLAARDQCRGAAAPAPGEAAAWGGEEEEERAL